MTAHPPRDTTMVACRAPQAGDTRARSLMQRDARADGETRVVELHGDHVLIARRVRNIAMRLKVPAHAYRGVALRLRLSASGESFQELLLAHSDPDLCVVLDQRPDGQDLRKDWLLWAAYFGVPALVERHEGNLLAAGPALGEAYPFARRRGCGLAHDRRGRFARRRKTGLAERMGVCFAGEREIVART